MTHEAKPTRFLRMAGLTISFEKLQQLDSELCEIACRDQKLAEWVLYACYSASVRDAGTKDLAACGARVLHPSVWQAVLDGISLCTLVQNLRSDETAFITASGKADTKNRQRVHFARDQTALREHLLRSFRKAQMPLSWQNRIAERILALYCGAVQVPST